jgi:hypothetical protein
MKYVKREVAFALIYIFSSLQHFGTFSILTWKVTLQIHIQFIDYLRVEVQ